MTSPYFKINGGGVGVKASVATGSTVTCLLDSVAGVTSTQWFIIRTDDTTTIAQWNATFVQSGAVGEQLTFTALGVGTACIVQAQVNNGYILGVPSAASRATAKVFVNTAEGLEVLTDDELVNTALEASPTHGAVDPINAAIRATGGAIGAYKPPVKAATAAALPAYTRVANVITANAVGAFSCDTLMTWAVGDTFLLNHGASGVDNGVYALNVIGDAGTAWVATRVWWMDESAEVPSGCLIPVVAGATYADEVFQLTTNNPIVINTTALTFSLWAGYWDRTGTVVHPEATGDAVAIGASTMLGTEKLRVVGPVAIQAAAGDSIPTVGTIRLPDVFDLYAWGTGPANVPILTKDAADNLAFGNNTFSLSTFLLAADNLQFYCGATQIAFINATAAYFKVPVIVNGHPVDGYTLTAVKTGAYNAVICDLVRVDPTGGGFAVTLPTAVGQAERGITVINYSASLNPVTFNTTAGQTINGMASGVDQINSAYESVTFISEGANWMRFPAA